MTKHDAISLEASVRLARELETMVRDNPRSTDAEKENAKELRKKAEYELLKATQL